MHPQLRAIVDDFGRAETSLHRLAATVPPDAWLRRPDPSRWSVGECITHEPGAARPLADTVAECDEWQRRAGDGGRRLTILRVNAATPASPDVLPFLPDLVWTTRSGGSPWHRASATS
jgi:hypothetical protein